MQKSPGFWGRTYEYDSIISSLYWPSPKTTARSKVILSCEIACFGETMTDVRELKG